MTHALITGGAGYIGSHMAHLLIKNGYKVTIVDNLSTGFRENIHHQATFIKLDLCHQSDAMDVLLKQQPDIIFHFAAKSLVGESMEQPWSYIHYNSLMTQNILAGMKGLHCKHLIYSSSCAVYGKAQVNPIPENHPHCPLSPYGESKAISERMIQAATSEWGLNAVALRYFNVAGCGDNSILQERHDPETHLIPNLLTAAKSNQVFSLYGTEHSTPDGTAIRDYIHVQDLVEAHAIAGEKLLNNQWHSWNRFNLGSGHGYSVQQVLTATENCTQRKIQTQKRPPRAGDPPQLLADESLWFTKTSQRAAKKDINDMIKSAWNALNDG